jgi:environmental stress-induced protein Ves
MTLTHEGHYSRELGAFEQDSFQGDWTTRSRGRVTDFNVMTVGGDSSVEVLDAAGGDAEVLNAAAGEVDVAGVDVAVERGSLVLYLLSAAKLRADGETLVAQTGDVFVATGEAVSVRLEGRAVAARIIHDL